MTNLEALIDRWRAGDERAARLIYEQHRERTYRLAYALVNNHEDAEEAAQDALAYALVNIGRFDKNRSKFTTWLHMITVSRSRDLLRKRRFPTLAFGSFFRRGMEPADRRPGPEEQTTKMEIRAEVWDAVQSLSPLLREAIILRHWGAHTYQEMGEILGCPMKTAQSRVRLAHQKLANSLDQPNGLVKTEKIL